MEKLINGKKTELVTKTIVNLVLQAFNPPLSFPTKEKSYTLEKLSIPSFMHIWNNDEIFKFQAQIGIHVKSVKSNKLVLITNMVLEGNVTK